jgi:2-C-methyl-D-erythritol 4-phosphate cytidylyltransferase
MGKDGHNPVYAVLLASGRGERMGSDLPKQFLKIGDKTVVEHSLHAFDAMGEIDGIVLVVHGEYRELMEDLLAHHPVQKIVALVDGGETRQQSAYIGLMHVPVQSGQVLIHDAVRPLVSANLSRACLSGLADAAAVTCAIPTSDTIIEVDEQGFIAAVPPRNRLWRVQTPQAFELALIRQAHQRAIDESYFHATDDCSLILRYQLSPVWIVSGETRNLKLTHMEDLALAEYLLNGHTL